MHVDEQRARAPKILILAVETLPVSRHPVIAGVTAKDRARLKFNHCFATSPGPSSVESVTRGNEGIIAIAGNTAYSPYRAAVRAGGGGRGPCRNAGWFIYRHSYQPAIVSAAIPHAPIPNIKNAASNGQGRSLLLELRVER